MHARPHLSDCPGHPVSRLSGMRRRFCHQLAALGGLALSAGLLDAAGVMPATGIARAQPFNSGRRTALIIGNANYRVAPLRNPVNDARLVASTLQEIGFEVTLLEDGSQRAMVDNVRRWVANSASADVRTFYFAGHGTQFEGNNYLLPIDLAILQETQIRSAALMLSDIVDALSAQEKGVNFVIIDACRTDPSSLLNRPVGRTRGFNQPHKLGLNAQMAPRGTVVAYSTAPGSLAADGDNDRNSLFTRALATELRKPGLPVESLFKQVRLSVMQATANAQIPWERSSLVGDFCFLPDPRGRCGVQP